MALTSGSFNSKDFGEGGGGGLLGVGHNCRLTGFDVREHALTKVDKKTGAVIEKFPTSCFLRYQIDVLDPVEDGQPSTGIQYAQIGQLPLTRSQQIGEPGDPKFTGGYLPSADNETPAPVGPFLLLDGKTDVWKGADGAMFLAELQSLAAAAGHEDQYLDRLAKMGVTALDGLEADLNTKAKPKGRKAAADPTSKDRNVIVPVRVTKWPWEAGAGTGSPAAATGSAPVIATPLPLAQPTQGPGAIVTEAPATVAAAGSSTEQAADTLAIERLKAFVISQGGSVLLKDFMTPFFASLSDLNANQKMPIMKRVNLAMPYGQQWLAAAAKAGHFLVDADSIMVIG